MCVCMYMYTYSNLHEYMYYDIVLKTAMYTLSTKHFLANHNHKWLIFKLCMHMHVHDMD